LSAGADGALVLSWLEPDGDDYVLKYSTLRDMRWSAAAAVARGADWVVSPADPPSVRSLTSDLWAADWRVPAAAAPYAYDIEVAVSADGGVTWSAPLRLNDDGTPTEHGFVSWFAHDGRAAAIWLDGRDNVSEELMSGAFLGTSLRYAYLDGRGVMVEQGVLDEVACDCCQTDVDVAAGRAAVIYRDRSAEEIRDVVVRTATANGWSEPVTLGPDGWQIEGCPVNGPALDTDGRSIAAAWFTAADGRARTRFAWSSDGGTTFAPGVDVDGADAIGHVGVALAGDDAAYVSWWRRRAAGGAELAVRRVSAAGELGALRVVATSASSRPDDVPQLERSGNGLVFAWTETGEAQMVKVAYAGLDEAH
jgi:hypothetical protein